MEYQELDDLKYIKKHYGEKMSHLCRELFPSILETPGLLYHLLTSNFNPSRSLYYDIVNEQKEFIFKEYIYNFVDDLKEEIDTSSVSVKELLDSAGYDIYECKTNEEIQKYKKYYAKGEELCTFKDPARIKFYRVFFLVKKNVKKYNRHNYKNPVREDEYSTSVLCIQFDRGIHQRVSIKSRYNHTVKHPDATYSNNLELIVPGLTAAFEQDYGFNIGNDYMTNFELDNYVQAQNGKYYKYNYEINNVHYCPDNIIIDNGKVIDTYKDKGRYTVLDYFILDEKEKRIFLYNDFVNDSFIQELTDIKDIKITNVSDDREIVLTYKENRKAIIKINKDNKIIEYKNNNIYYLDDNFLFFNNKLSKIDLPNLEVCGKNILYYNEALEEIDFPNLVGCGDYFIFSNRNISNMEMPSLERCGDSFLFNNSGLKKCYLPKLKRCSSVFIGTNTQIEELYAPKLEHVGNSFLTNNNALVELSLPKLKSCGWSFIQNNSKLEKINLPNLESAGNLFLMNARNRLKELASKKNNSTGRRK